MTKFNFGKICGMISLFYFFIFLFSFAISSCDNPLIQQIVGAKTAVFESNGGSDVESQTVFRDQPVKRPSDPSRSGHTFGAWYSDNGTFLEEWDFAAVPTGDITLYAKWNAVIVEPPVVETCTVTFNKNGGDTDAIPASRTVNPGSLVTAPETNPTRAYFEFDGWYKEADCINIWDFAADTVTANITLYAKWKEIPGIEYFTVTFNKNGGDTEASPRSREVVSGLLVTAPAAPGRTGYTFTGWYKEADCINIWDFAADTVSADITLYAKWDISQYTVDFHTDGGSAVNPITNVTHNSTITEPAAPTKAGFTFGGWYKDADCINVWDFATDTVSANTTLYAKWETIPGIDYFTVTFDKNGGDTEASPHSHTVVAGGLVTAPENAPTKTGYTFGGWYTEAACENVWNFATDTVSADITLYANWVEVPVVPDGTGTEEAPFLVRNETELRYVGRGTANSDGYTEWTLDKHYRQTVNITLEEGNWTEIGDGNNSARYFTGTYNGGGYTITRLTISSTTNYPGMFSGIGTDGKVENLGLIDVNIKTTNGSSGGIAGRNVGTIQNCYVSGSVTGSATAGGIAASNSGTIQNCYITGSVTITNTLYSTSGGGGITGIHTGTIRNCVALNESVTLGGNTNIGRISGYGTSTRQNNYAWSGITLTLNDSPVTATPSLTGKDGADITAAQAKTQGAWETAGFTFTSDSPWEWNTQYSRPVLKNEVPQAWPDYLVDTVAPPAPTWTAVTTSVFDAAVGSSIFGIAYGGGTFVAAGYKMAYSANGTSWTAVSNSTFSGGGDTRDIAYVNGRFVAVGSSGHIAYSTDNGVTWTAVANSTFGSLDSIYAIAYGNGTFVAGDTDGKMAYSTDNGITWTTVTDTTFGTNYVNSVNAIVYGNGRFVAGNNWGKMAYSADGITWTAVSNSTFGTSAIYGIAYGNNRWVAGGGAGKMAYSTDNGVTWTAVTDSTFGTSSIRAIAYGNGTWIAGGDGGKMAYSSDGVTWTAISGTDSTFGTSAIYGIAYANNRFVAVGNNGKMAYSGDYVAPPATIISSAALTVTAPANGGTPATTVSGTGNFTVGTVSWSPSVTTFTTGQPYTVNITLTANANYTFTGGLTTATINGETATISNNTGASVTLSWQFDALSAFGIEMVQVPGGSFQMGKELNPGSGYSDVTVHSVTLTGFYIGKYEVTQAQYQAVMGSLPSSLPGNSYGVGNNYPVYYVSWYDALVFCNKLSVMEGLTPAYRISNSTNPDDWGTVPTSSSSTWNAVTIDSGSTGYRLPTEAQWEYAAKGGDPTAAGWVGYTYAGSNNPDEVAWYNNNNGSASKAVGTKAPNGLGIYDMSGNVYEWCWDWYESYSSAAQTDPLGASSGSFRVERGGNWGSSAEYVRSAYRYYVYPYLGGTNRGFRLLRP
jgi:uncharacterized repeat protein (TIGR02543 family)